jgi:hypothetical protein
VATFCAESMGSIRARFDYGLKFSRLTTKFGENSRVSRLIRLIRKNALCHYIDFSHYTTNYTRLTSGYQQLPQLRFLLFSVIFS